ncbi:hypothetical protein OIT44_02985 [Weissella ceti]|uniref:Uncharacterized protein n=1 Tax=Weissella ceti TaxID=759620 RepID=A0ABT3E3S3_9LACO|nr:hypothetical protein [Weissella ceti]MCW0953037.1 hypothetical protein [Weissella ceti]QVK11582.1 hypothetical protein KHQ31_04995 [Weissella ceti]
MTAKLTIQSKNKATSGLNPVFVSADTHARIKGLSASTGITIKELTEDMLVFALNNLQINPSPDGSNPE